MKFKEWLIKKEWHTSGGALGMQEPLPKFLDKEKNKKRRSEILPLNTIVLQKGLQGTKQDIGS